MTRYCAFLRGVNVNGRKMLMKDVKDLAQVDEMVSAVPFEDDPDLHVYAFVCDDGLADTLLENFQTVTPVAGETAAVSSGCFFWQVPKGSTLDAGFSKTLGDPGMRAQLTSRNISTIRKVQAVMHAS